MPRSAHGAAVFDGKLWIFAGYDGNNRYDTLSGSLQLVQPLGFLVLGARDLRGGGFFFLSGGDFFWKGVGTLPPTSDKSSLYIRSFTVRKNPISSDVNEF